MPGRMGEVPGQFPLAKHTTRSLIHFGGSRARTNSRDGGLLRFEHGLVQPSSLSRRLSDMHGSRAIRTITGEYNTKIADHEPAPGNARARGAAMHNCRTSSRSEYCREGHSFGPGTTSLVFHGGGDFDLTHTGPNFLARDAEQAGTEFNRPPDAQDLASVLHHAGALDQRWRGTQARPPFQHRRQPVAHADRDRLRLNANRCRGRLSSLRGQPLCSRHQWGFTNNNNARTLYFLSGLGPVAAVGKEDGTTITDNQSGRTAGKATEIVDIGEVRDQQAINLVFREQRLEAKQATSVIHDGRVHGNVIHGRAARGMECSRGGRRKRLEAGHRKSEAAGISAGSPRSRRRWLVLTWRVGLNDARSNEEDQLLVSSLHRTTL